MQLQLSPVSSCPGATRGLSLGSRRLSAVTSGPEGRPHTAVPGPDRSVAAQPRVSRTGAAKQFSCSGEGGGGGGGREIRADL